MAREAGAPWCLVVSAYDVQAKTRCARGGVCAPRTTAMRRPSPPCTNLTLAEEFLHDLGGVDEVDVACASEPRNGAGDKRLAAAGVGRGAVHP